MKKCRMRHLARWLLGNLLPDGCTGTWQMLDAWCRMHGRDAEFIKQAADGYASCDCELLLNVFLCDDGESLISPDTAIPKTERTCNEPQ
jgi:hypothetical protein